MGLAQLGPLLRASSVAVHRCVHCVNGTHVFGAVCTDFLSQKHGNRSEDLALSYYKYTRRLLSLLSIRFSVILDYFWLVV